MSGKERNRTNVEKGRETIVEKGKWRETEFVNPTEKSYEI